MAQQEDALTAPTELHREPDGTPLVSLPLGAPVETGEIKGDWTQATVEGWVFSASTAPTRREGFDLVVTSNRGENLRRSPNGPVVGRLREGTLLERVAVKGKWTRVRRDGWVPREAMGDERRPTSGKREAEQKELAQKEQAQQSQKELAQKEQGQGPAPAARTPTPVASKAAPDAEPMELARETALSATPDGAQLATVQGGVPARVVARAAGWVKVQVDGWVKDSEIRPSDAGAAAGVTAAEVRTAPDRFVGRILEWRVQLIAVQSADELRSEMTPGQPYLLTRGPLPEAGFVYVTIPATRVAEFRALPPLRELVLRVTLKAARTKYLATPVVELASVVSGMEGKEAP